MHYHKYHCYRYSFMAIAILNNILLIIKCDHDSDYSQSIIASVRLTGIIHSNYNIL